MISTSRSSRCTHNRKIDAPSGTALLLGHAAAEGRKVDLAQRSVRSRDGHTGARERGRYRLCRCRGGTVVGDHRIVFAGPYERIELNHKAEDRMIFARGALKAALWARGTQAGSVLDDRCARSRRFLERDLRKTESCAELK